MSQRRSVGDDVRLRIDPLECLSAADDAARAGDATEVSACAGAQPVDRVDNGLLADEAEGPGVVAGPRKVDVRIVEGQEASRRDELVQREEQEQALLSSPERGPGGVRGEWRSRSEERSGRIREGPDEEPERGEEETEEDEAAEDPADPGVADGFAVRKVDLEASRLGAVLDSNQADCSGKHFVSAQLASQGTGLAALFADASRFGIQ